MLPRWRRLDWRKGHLYHPSCLHSLTRTWWISCSTPKEEHRRISMTIFAGEWGRRAEDNLKKIQEEGIPRVTEWAKCTGSCFAAEKTELIHLTRRKRDLSKGSIIMESQTIKASATTKLLGVAFDQELRWKDHVQQAVKRCSSLLLVEHLFVPTRLTYQIRHQSRAT
jgi:hypothetical protein